MLNICLKSKKFDFTGRMNAFRVIERPERIEILGGQNTENVNNRPFYLHIVGRVKIEGLWHLFRNN